MLSINSPRHEPHHTQPSPSQATPGFGNQSEGLAQWGESSYRAMLQQEVCLIGPIPGHTDTSQISPARLRHYASSVAERDPCRMLSII